MQLNDISIVLAEALDTEDLFKRIAESFRVLTGAIAATFSVYNQETRTLKAVSLSIDPLFSSKVSSFFGPDLFEMQMPVSEDVKKEMLVQSIARPKDLCELTFGVMPQEISDTVMEAVGCRQIVALAIRHADELIGTCVAYLPGDQPVVPDDALKTYIHLSGLAIKRKQAEEDLQKSERKARALLDFSYGFIGLLTPEGLVLEANQTALEFVRAQLSDIAGKPFWETPWWSHSAEMQEKLRAAVRDAASGKLVRFEATHPSPDGSLRVIDFSLKPVKDENGNVIFLIPEGRDITERKKMEESLRDIEARYTLIMSNITDRIWLTDMNFKIIWASESVSSNRGYQIEEKNPLQFSKLLTPGSLEIAVKIISEELTPQRLQQKDIDISKMLELEFLRKDGSTFWSEVRLKVLRDDNGIPNAILGVGRDITERKRAEEEIRKNEAIMESVFNSAPIAVIVIGPDRILRYVVGNTNDIIGYTHEEMIGRTSRFLYFTDEEYTQAGAALYGKAVSGNITIEVRMRRKDGTEIWILLSGFPFKFEDSSAGLVVAAIDISARRAIEGRLRQSQKMEAIGQLAGGVAHDFNNMLTAILGYTDMVLFDLKPEDKNREKLTEVHKAGQRAAALTKQLLAFSRRQVLQLAPIDLNQTIEDLIKMLRRLIGENIELLVALDHELLTINADRSQIEQVIMNLCINARDAMPNGGRLSIETGNVFLDASYCSQYEWAKPGRYVFLSITDSGYGMDSEIKGKIFDPFFTTKEADKGTGLGLATVYGIVRQHNGGIQVYSEPGKGSMFTIYLPAIEHEETSILTESIENIPAGRHETILLAEDNEQVRYIAIRFLEDSGYKLLTAVDGEDALRVYKKHGAEIDLLLLDVVMPKKGGRNVYDEIRSVRPDIKCLFISGYSVNAVHTNFILDQGLHLIQKPFLKDDLLRAVRRRLDQV